MWRLREGHLLLSPLRGRAREDALTLLRDLALRRREWRVDPQRAGLAEAKSAASRGRDRRLKVSVWPLLEPVPRGEAGLNIPAPYLAP